MAFMLVPMRSLGQDNWKIAAALMGSYIGGGKFFFYSEPYDLCQHSSQINCNVI